MDRGRVARRPRWEAALAVVTALPACGLIVGWEPRPECDDCESLSTTSGAGSPAGGASATSSGGSSSGGADAGSTAAGPTGSGGGPATSQGSGGTASGTEGGGAGGSAADGGASGAGGTATGGSSGTGGSIDSGSGGSAGAMPTGGVIPVTGQSRCTPSAIADVASGAHPAELQLGENQLRAWTLAWLDAGDVYFRAYLEDGTSLTEEAHVLATGPGVRSAPALATDGLDVAIAFGQSASNSATLNLHYLPALTPTSGSSDEIPSAGSDSPVIGGVLRIGSDRFLAAAVDASGTGQLSIFQNGVHQASGSVGTELESIGVARLGGSLGIVVWIEAGALSLATLDLNGTDLSLNDVEGAALGSPTPGQPVRVTSLASGAAMVWVEEDGVFASVLDATGALLHTGQVAASDTAVLPHVASYEGEVLVSWLDSANSSLFLRRLSGDLSGGEEQLPISLGVAHQSYGLAVNPLVNVPSYGLVFGTDRLELWQVVCEE